MTCVLSLKPDRSGLQASDKEPVYVLIGDRAVKAVVAQNGRKLLLEERFFCDTSGVGEKVPRGLQKTKFLRESLILSQVKDKQG